MTDAPKLPEWLAGTTRKDWLRDGYAMTEEQWADFDWSRAWVDMGPSPRWVRPGKTERSWGA
ncbi:hypothetical protein ACVIJ6_000919 [Bradyrhizobium sp. USDA 4369]